MENKIEKSPNIHAVRLKILKKNSFLLVEQQSMALRYRLRPRRLLNDP